MKAVLECTLTDSDALLLTIGVRGNDPEVVTLPWEYSEGGDSVLGKLSQMSQYQDLCCSTVFSGFIGDDLRQHIRVINDLSDLTEDCTVLGPDLVMELLSKGMITDLYLYINAYKLVSAPESAFIHLDNIYYHNKVEGVTIHHMKDE